MACGGRHLHYTRAWGLWHLPLLLSLLSLLPRASSVSEFAGSDFVPPDPLRICVTSYAPFVMDSRYQTGGEVGNVSFTGPLAYGELKGLTPVSTYMVSNDTRLGGYDIEYSRLIFEEMLGLNVSYIASSTFAEMYLDLRDGSRCDVSISAAEMDPSRTLCTSVCPSGPFTVTGDYDYGGFDETTLAGICCLEYGAPYISEGFALLSVLTTAPFDVASALFNADVGNAALVIILMMISVGFLVHLVEHDNPHLGSFSRGTYWGLMSFFLMAENMPQSKKGRFLTAVWLCTNLVSMSVITSIISAKLTTSSLVAVKIEGLADITGTLCLEAGYPVAQQFVERNPNKPTSVVYDEIDKCIALMMNGTYAAVLSDSPVLTWFVSNYGLQNTYISPVLMSNPFSFVYHANNYNSTKLRQFVNPAVIATLTQEDYIQKRADIQLKYIAVGASAAPDAVATQIELKTLEPVCILIFTLFLIALITGELGPGLSTRWWATRRLRQFLSAPPMPAEEGDGASKEASELRAVAFSQKGDGKAGGSFRVENGASVPVHSHAEHNNMELMVALLSPLLAELRDVKAEVMEVKAALRPQMPRGAHLADEVGRRRAGGAAGGEKSRHTAGTLPLF